MSKSSRKGDRREKEWADLWDGTKISRKGYQGPDVITPPLHINKLAKWEVKSAENLPLWFIGVNKDGDEGWITQMEREGADALAFRQNYGDWYIIVRADKLEDDC